MDPFYSFLNQTDFNIFPDFANIIEEESKATQSSLPTPQTSPLETPLSSFTHNSQLNWSKQASQENLSHLSSKTNAAYVSQMDPFSDQIDYSEQFNFFDNSSSDTDFNIFPDFANIIEEESKATHSSLPTPQTSPLETPLSSFTHNSQLNWSKQAPQENLSHLSSKTNAAYVSQIGTWTVPEGISIGLQQPQPHQSPSSYDLMPQFLSIPFSSESSPLSQKKRQRQSNSIDSNHDSQSNLYKPKNSNKRQKVDQENHELSSNDLLEKIQKRSKEIENINKGNIDIEKINFQNQDQITTIEIPQINLKHVTTVFTETKDSINQRRNNIRTLELNIIKLIGHCEILNKIKDTLLTHEINQEIKMFTEKTLNDNIIHIEIETANDEAIQNYVKLLTLRVLELNIIKQGVQNILDTLM